MRGGLGIGNYLENALEKLADARKRSEPVFIPHDFVSSQLCWDFSGTVKFLTDCSKEELLYVCECLCQKLASSTSYSEHLEQLRDGMREQSGAA